MSAEPLPAGNERPQPRRTQLDALTGLRFIAALHVLLYHEARSLFGIPAIERLVGTGYIGVQLFFVLSGFILAYTYTDGWRASIDRGTFFTARFARVYPVYALALLVALPQFAVWAGDKLSAEQLVGVAKVVVTAAANILLVQAWLVPTVAQWNAPGWSLSVEATFYATFPFIAARLVRLPTKRVIATLVIVWLASLVPPLLYDLRFPGSSHEDPGMLLAALKYVPLLRVGEFIIGAAAGVVFLRLRETAAPRALGGAGALAVIAFTIMLLSLPTPIAYPFLHNALFAPLFALMIYALARGDGALASTLGQGWLVALGQASYAMYLLHEPIAWLLYKNEYGPLRMVAGWTRFLLYLAVVIAVSLLVFRYWEEPLRRAIRARRLSARGPSETPSRAAPGLGR